MGHKGTQRFLEIVFPVMIFITSKAYCLLSLDRTMPCAAGISTIPPLDKLGLPADRFPAKVPSGVNLCDASCIESSKCTYNWAESLQDFPFLLFRCYCPNNNICPPPKMMFEGYLKVHCEDVTSRKTRCICPYGKSSYKCTLNIIPKANVNSYYCVCCNEEGSTY